MDLCALCSLDHAGNVFVAHFQKGIAEVGAEFLPYPDDGQCLCAEGADEVVRVGDKRG
jgi:hypothetical protein